MTILISMRPEVYPSYCEYSIVSYAEANIAAGRWPKEGALLRARKEFEHLLPQGLATSDNYLFEILAREGEDAVGFLWFAIQERQGIRGAFVYEIQIKEPFRRQGYARQALLLLEPVVAGLGITTIGLHVFTYNTGAQALYDQLGYTATGINMRKEIGGANN